MEFIGGRAPDLNAIRREAEIEAKAGGVLRRHAQRRHRAQEERFDAIGAAEKARELQRRLDELDEEIRRAPFGRREGSAVRQHFRELERERNEVAAEFPPGHKPRVSAWLLESEGKRWTLTPRENSARDPAFDRMVAKRMAEAEAQRPGRRARHSGMTRREREAKAIVRDRREQVLLRSTQSGAMPVLSGYGLRFGEPTEIESILEGHFIEIIEPGAARKTLADNGRSIRVMFNHGTDPSIGEKPLCNPTFTEDSSGVRYEGQLFDTDYCRELVPALKAEQLGASFRFRVVRESFIEEPGPSPDNPKGLPERHIEEIELFEMGPVVFPAYAGSTAGVA